MSDPRQPRHAREQILKTKAPPLILLSGMGADERVFAAQMQAIPNLMVPKWIAPEFRFTAPGTAYCRPLTRAPMKSWPAPATRYP